MVNFFRDYFFTIREFFGGWMTGHMTLLYIASILLSAFFLVATIYILIKARWFTMKREQFLDSRGKEHLTKRRSRIGWKQIQRRFDTGEMQQWKIGILEADKILNEILKMSGYLGADLSPKLEKILPSQLASIEEVKRAHALAVRVATEPDFELTKEATLTVLRVYKKAFQELNLIED